MWKRGENRRTEWKLRLVSHPGVSFENEFSVPAVKNYANADIKYFRSHLMLLDFLTLCEMF